MNRWVLRIGYAAAILWIAGVTAWAVFSQLETYVYAQNLLRDTIVLGVFGCAAWAVGEFIRKRLGDSMRGLEGVLSSLALGLGFYAVLIFLIGTLKLLYREALLGCLGLGLLFAVKPFSTAISNLKKLREDTNKI